MEANALKQMVLYSFDHRSCEIEKDLKVVMALLLEFMPRLKN